MVSKIIDVTTDFNANNGIKMDLSEWQFVSFQFVLPTGTINITGSNDGGEVTGSVSPGPLTSTNFVTIQALNIGAINTPVSVVTAPGIYAFNPLLCKYVQFSGASAGATKVLVFVSRQS